MFSQACVIPSVHWGWLSSMHHWSHDGGVLHPGGLHPRGGGSASRGIGQLSGYYGIRSTSGRYTFYWNASFLGGLSLHLNHLIASCMTNYDWPFGTLPFGLFWSNLDTRDLERYPRTYSGHFWNMSIFDDSRAVWVLFRKWVVSEN